MLYEKNLVLFKKLDPEAITPTRGHSHDAGFDLYCLETVDLLEGFSRKLRTGIAIEVPTNFFGLVMARSSTYGNNGVMLTNGAGVIDCGYTGEILIPVIALGGPAEIKKGDRLTQIIFVPILPNVVLAETSTLTSLSDRGEGGFGSTNK